jgi:hypothetical protein
VAWPVSAVEQYGAASTRGYEVGSDSHDFQFEDDSGRLEWLAPDRAIVTFRDLEDVDVRQSAVVDLVNRWVAA